MDGLDRSTTRWNVIPQQIMMARVDRRPGDTEVFGMDIWSGYEVARRRLMEFLATRRPANPIVLTGDIHSNWVNDLEVDYENEMLRSSAPSSWEHRLAQAVTVSTRETQQRRCCWRTRG